MSLETKLGPYARPSAWWGLNQEHSEPCLKPLGRTSHWEFLNIVAAKFSAKEIVYAEKYNYYVLDCPSARRNEM